MQKYIVIAKRVLETHLYLGKHSVKNSRKNMQIHQNPNPYKK